MTDHDISIAAIIISIIALVPQLIPMLNRFRGENFFQEVERDIINRMVSPQIPPDPMYDIVAVKETENRQEFLERKVKLIINKKVFFFFRRNQRKRECLQRILDHANLLPAETQYIARELQKIC